MDRFFIDELEGNFAYIKNKDEILHISKTLRMQCGDKLEVINGNGFVAIAEITDILKKEISVKILEEINDYGELNTDITVYQGIPKHQKMEFIIQKLTEIGIKKIVPVNFARCVKKIKEKESKQIERWQRIALEATKQSKRTYMPTIANCVEVYELEKDIADNNLTLICYELEKDINLKKILKEIEVKKNLKVGLIIGPEGGITEVEYKFLSEKGAKSVSLGKSILRTETAGIFASSILAYELE